MHIPDLPYVNPVVLNLVMKSVIAGKLQEFKDVNRPSPPDYNKPYPSWQDDMSFPPRYRQPKFQMFDSSGDPDQYLAHFISACGDTVRKDSLLLWQFVLSLKGPTFDWYTKLLESFVPTS